MERPKFKDILKIIDLLAPILRSASARKELMKMVGGVAGGAGVVGLANNKKQASLDKAEVVYRKLCQNK